MSEDQELIIRANIAVQTGDGGDAHGALRLFEQLLADQQRVLDSDHPDVLTTRHNIAYWTSQGGDAGAALELF